MYRCFVGHKTNKGGRKRKEKSEGSGQAWFLLVTRPTKASVGFEGGKQSVRLTKF
jgi:hypothetical protein